MTRAEWEALIQRVEQASGPSRELDAEISVAVGRHETHIERRSDGTAKLLPWRGDGTGSYNIDCRRYTASLDAAVSLVPSGWTAWGLRSRGGLTSFYAEISRIHGPEDEEQAVFGRGPTPALALVAAALRAQRAMREEG